VLNIIIFLNFFKYFRTGLPYPSIWSDAEQGFPVPILDNV
jgi:hypothetical protein